MFRSTLSALLIGATLPSLAAAGCYDDAMLVFDGSGSMATRGYHAGAASRIDEARQALSRSLPSIPQERRIGLLTYGPGKLRGMCVNIHLRLSPTPGAASAIAAEVDRMEPFGDTPMTAAVEAAADVLRHETRASTIVLITDGEETCGGAVCATAKRLADTGVRTVIHVVDFRRVEAEGISAPPAEQAPACMAHQTGGLYLAAETAEELESAFRMTLGCPLLSDARPADQYPSWFLPG